MRQGPPPPTHTHPKHLFYFRSEVGSVRTAQRRKGLHESGAEKEMGAGGPRGGVGGGKRVGAPTPEPLSSAADS